MDENIKDNDQAEAIVNEFYDLVTKAELSVKHAAHQVTNQTRAKKWEWELAGSYIIANSCGTVAMATDGLRLARFTASPASGIGDSQMRGFLPYHGKRVSENNDFYDEFNRILADWTIVQSRAFYSRKKLIASSQSEESNTQIVLGLKVLIVHILDFCQATKEDLITCLVVLNQSRTTARLKLIAGSLEELLIPIERGHHHHGRTRRN